MKGFLNDFMSEQRDLGATTKNRYQELFYTTIDRAYGAFGKSAFRPSRSLNVATFDALMVAIAKHPSATKSQILAAAKLLQSDEAYIANITRATSDDLILKSRINQAKMAFNAVS